MSRVVPRGFESGGALVQWQATACSGNRLAGDLRGVLRRPLPGFILLFSRLGELLLWYLSARPRLLGFRRGAPVESAFKRRAATAALSYAGCGCIFFHVYSPNMLAGSVWFA